MFQVIRMYCENKQRQLNLRNVLLARYYIARVDYKYTLDETRTLDETLLIKNRQVNKSTKFQTGTTQRTQMYIIVSYLIANLQPERSDSWV